MSESNKSRLSSISKANSYEGIGEFWDTHSSADYWDQGHDVEFEIQEPHRHRISIEADLFGRISTEARQRGVSAETLVNLWIVERLHLLGAEESKRLDDEAPAPRIEAARRQLAEEDESYSAQEVNH
jgi:hypothetical protein